MKQRPGADFRTALAVTAISLDLSDGLPTMY